MTNALVDDLVAQLRAAKRKEKRQLIGVGVVFGAVIALSIASCGKAGFSNTIGGSSVLGGGIAAIFIAIAFLLGRDTFAKNPAIIALRDPSTITDWKLDTRYIVNHVHNSTTFSLTTKDGGAHVLDVPAIAEALTWRALRQLAPTVGPQEDAPPPR